MTIAFLSSKSEGVVNVLKSVRDNLDIVGGLDLIDFLSETRERSEFFSRVVISENALTSGNEEQDFLFLKDYIESYSPNLEVVLAISRESGSMLADMFTGMFSAPMYTVAYLPERTSTSVIVEMVENPVLEIKAKYFSIDNTQVKAKELSAKETKKPVKKKKQGLFGKLFGGKKAEVVEEDEEPQVPESPTPTPPIEEVPLVAPPVQGSVVNTHAPEVQESINKLFGNGGTVDLAEPTGEMSLNFSDFGDSHYQTGFIAEEDDDSTTSEPSVNVVNNEDGGWQSVNDFKPSSTFAEESVSPDFSGFYEPNKTEVSAPGNLGTSNSDFSEDSLLNSGSILPTLGVILVVGEESSSFLAQCLRGETGYYVIDTRKSLDLSSYIDESKYLSSDEKFYEEGGNFYCLGVEVSEINDLVFAKQKVIINASPDSLDSLSSVTDFCDSVIPVFSSDLARFESQVSQYELVSPKISRVLACSNPIVVGGITNDIKSLLSRSVFSRINWKGLFE